MQRIIILGNAGSGKSTLARELGKRLTAPVVHLDTLFWEPNWIEADNDIFRERIQQAIVSDRWICEGNYARRTFDLRLPRADLILWLDTPRTTCLRRELVRSLLDRPRPDKPLGCKEKLDREFLNFLNYCWNYDRVSRPGIEAARLAVAPQVPVVHLRSTRQVAEFLMALPTPPSPTQSTYTASSVPSPKAVPTRNWQSLVSSWDGFDREAGLRAIRSEQTSERLSAIIVRLNDWVPQVREAARLALDDYLTPSYTTWLIAQLPAIVALEKRKRENHRITLDKLEALLATPECLPLCAPALHASHGQCARLLFRVLAQSMTDEEREPFLIMSLHHPDFSVRRLALARAMELPQAAAQRAVAFGLASNSSILRRLSFLETLRIPAGRTRLIEDFLTDPSPATRSTALWAAKKYGVEPAHVLQAHLRGKTPDTKAQWLGVLGLAQDLNMPTTESWLAAAQEQKSGAVRSLVLDIEGGDRPARLIAAITDPSKSVFEAGVTGLRSQPWSVIASAFTRQLEDLWANLTSARRLALLELMPKWTQAGFLLQQLQSAPAEPTSLEQIRLWADAQVYAITDRETPKNQRDQIIEQLIALEANQALPAGAISRIA